MKTKRRVFPVVLVCVAFVLLSLFTLLDNWKRDLTTNYARLDDNSPDPSLRPVVISLPADEVADRIETWVTTMPNWSVESRQRNADHLLLHLTRRTRVLRFVDDIHVRLSEVQDKTRVDAESQSRVGVGDFGQNPRNLRELTHALTTRDT